MKRHPCRVLQVRCIRASPLHRNEEIVMVNRCKREKTLMRRISLMERKEAKGADIKSKQSQQLMRSYLSADQTCRRLLDDNFD